MLVATGATFLGDDGPWAIALFTAAVTRCPVRGNGALTALPWLRPLSSLGAWTGRYAAATGDVTEGLRIAEGRRTGEPGRPPAGRTGLAGRGARAREDDCRAHATAGALARALGHRLRSGGGGIASWALGAGSIWAPGVPPRPATGWRRWPTPGPGGIPSDGRDLLRGRPGRGGRAHRRDRGGTARRALARLGRVGRALRFGLGERAGRGPVPRVAGRVRRPPEISPTRWAGTSADGRPFDTARTELLFGEHLRRRRRRADARRHLRAAHETFDAARPVEPGPTRPAPNCAPPARRRASASRERVTRLTPQEVQIVRMVSTGATNREVATQMFLSPRTVDYHLRKVFTKLDVTSRAELARVAADGSGVPV